MSVNDKNFDTQATTFKRNIYGSSKGQVRQAILLRDLEHLISASSKQTLRVLDVGGGQGQIAMQLAQQGHFVTISDISAEMLEIARSHAKELNVLDRCHFIHAPLQELKNSISDDFDLVMCHAVFEWLEDPKSALLTLKQFCSVDGHISLMYFNRAGHELANLSYGNFDYLKAGLKAKNVVKLNPQQSIDSNDVIDWCEEFSLKIIDKSGVRCFHDLMRNREQWQNNTDEIIDLELKYSKLEPFASIARYIHLIIQQED